jgi:fimbrial chaperone protein
VRAPALSTIAALLLSALVAGPALAEGLQLTPVIVELTRDQTNAILSLRNDTASPVRYQLSAVTWDQDSAGQLKLAPTKDLILFPLLLALKAGEQRNVRVGVPPERFGAVEKTYRVFLDQLPSPDRPGNKPAVQVLTRVSIPVFLEPERTVPALRIEKAEISQGKVSFQLQNLGNVRVRPTEIVADALSGNGTAVTRQRWDGWYVLAGADRAYEWPLPKEGCDRVRSVRIEARLDGGKAVASSLELPGGGCVP